MLLCSTYIERRCASVRLSFSIYRYVLIRWIFSLIANGARAHTHTHVQTWCQHTQCALKINLELFLLSDSDSDCPPPPLSPALRAKTDPFIENLWYKMCTVFQNVLWKCRLNVGVYFLCVGVGNSWLFYDSLLFFPGFWGRIYGFSQWKCQTSFISATVPWLSEVLAVDAIRVRIAHIIAWQDAKAHELSSRLYARCA